MNDRYLYRAKRIDNGEWVEGYVIADEQNEEKCFIGYAFGTNDDGTPHDFDVISVDPSTICQCTGLKDKNGKLIWENDIVKHYNNPDYPETYDLGIVYWDNYKSGFERTSRTAKENVRINDSYIYEVIGSAIENPELLEVDYD